MMREGKDDLETHESIQIKRHERKYTNGTEKRHAGQNRLKHRRADDNKTAETTGEKTS